MSQESQVIDLAPGIQDTRKGCPYISPVFHNTTSLAAIVRGQFRHEAQPVREACHGADTDTQITMPGGATMLISGAGDGQRSDG